MPLGGVGGVLSVSGVDEMDLRRFQKTFLRGVLASGIDTATLSMPRGNGKSTLAAYILTRGLTPGDSLWRPGAEYILLAGSLEQARLCFRPVRADLEPTGEYRFLDSQTRIGITHVETNTKLRVISSNAKTAMGLGGVANPLVVADEPGAWETVGGELMFDALQTALGKPDSEMRIIYIGTLAPQGTEGHWWHTLATGGSGPSSYYQVLQGDPERWDQWPEIRRCNPLTAVSAQFRRKLLEERDAARQDTSLKARFLSYRLNVPSGDESETLITPDDWVRVLAREVPPAEGRPIVGIDLGSGRAWSAAVAIWRSGRVEAIALCPGIPSIEEQEKRDHMPRGIYARLVESGRLRVAEGLRVQPPALLWEMILSEWGAPSLVIADRFRVNDLRDAGANPLEARVTRWSEASADIRAVRRMVKDGPMAVETRSRNLFTVSMSQARIANDTSGNSRLMKAGSNNTGRDDVVAALLLAAGAAERYPEPAPSWTSSTIMVG